MTTSALAWKSGALLLFTLGAQTAFADQGIAYAWIPSGSSPSISAEYSFNPGGGPITVSRLGAGQYNVTFANSGIGTGWGVQATAYGSNSNFCNIQTWGASTVDVLCFNSAGASADSSFTVLAVSNGNDKNIAFAWADQSTTANYTPSTLYSFNPAGTISASRSSTGSYAVVFNGLSGAGGDVQVSAYGSINTTCVSGGWGGSFLANVNCFNAAGNPVDSQFVIAIVPASVSPTGIAFSWANDDSDAIYTPSSIYTYNPTTSATQITRSSVGQYEVTFAHLNASGVIGGNVRATSYTSTVRCKVESWGPGSDDSFRVDVGCFNTAGNAADSEYEVLVLPPMGTAYAWIFDGTAASVSPVYTLNPGGATVTATHNSTGNYNVTFPHSGIGTGWGVQAIAYGGSADYCKVGSWGGGVINVLCFTGAGAAADSPFTVTAVSNTNDKNIAFAWADQPSNSAAGGYTPSTSYSYNPAGGITVTRGLTGNYTVTFSGLSGAGGDVQITAYGSGNVSCYSNGWGGNPISAFVQCQNPSGTAVDSFFVIYVIPASVSPSGIAFAWADQDTTASYTPSTTYSYNPGGAVKVQRTGVGSYVMTFSGLDSGFLGGDVRATAYATTAHCKVASWSSGTNDMIVSVNCYNTGGALVDALYEVLAYAPTLGVPSSISVNGGSGQSTTVLTTFATALSAKVTDVNGNALSGVSVTFNAPTSGASGTFAGGVSSVTATTNASGVATATAFTANSTAGAYTVTASSLGISGTANFSLTNTASSSCVITLTPASASFGPIGTSTSETCPNGSGQPNCGVTPETPRSFTVTPSAACGAWTATSSNPVSARSPRARAAPAPAR